MRYNNQLTVDPNGKHENSKHDKQRKAQNISRPSVIEELVISEMIHCMQKNRRIENTLMNLVHTLWRITNRNALKHR